MYGNKMKMISLVVLVLAGLTVLSLCFMTREYDMPATDEFVLCFNSAADYDSQNGNWHMPISGRIFEPEAGSKWREMISTLAFSLDNLQDEQTGDKLLRERLSDFLADNESLKKLAIEIAGRQFVMDRTGRDGVFNGVIELTDQEVSKYRKGAYLEYRIVTAQDDKRVFAGLISLVAEGSTCVISDIDDTIKVSEVTNKAELLKNVFSRPYKATDGMVDFYNKLAAEGASFFYVSASPMQLYRPLHDFMVESGYPSGSIALRDFYAADLRVLNMLEESGAVKKPVIAATIERFNSSSFILIGDSGEQDAVIYGQIARQYPGRVKQIIIRCVSQLSQPQLEALKQSAGELPEGCEFKAFVRPEE